MGFSLPSTAHGGICPSISSFGQVALLSGKITMLLWSINSSASHGNFCCHHARRAAVFTLALFKACTRTCACAQVKFPPSRSTDTAKALGSNPVAPGGAMSAVLLTYFAPFTTVVLSYKIDTEGNCKSYLGFNGISLVCFTSIT